MKTRILYTKIWEDDFVSTLPLIQKALFIYFITNQRIGQTGIYEVTDRIILFETGATPDQLQQAKDKFMQAGKILFIDGWVQVANSGKYNSYTGDSNKKAYEKEIESIPSLVTESFKNLTLGGEGVGTLSGVPDSPSNHNHNKKSIIIIKGVVKGKIEELKQDESYLQKVAEDYKVPLPFVLSKLDDVDNWISEKPSRATGRDLKLTLRKWVKTDAMKIQTESRGSRIAVMQT